MKPYTFNFNLIIFISVVIVSITACKKSSPSPGNQENLADPIVYYYSDISGNVGDTLWIAGKNFSKTTQNNTVKFSSALAIAIKSKINSGTVYDSLEVIVPPGASTDVLKISVLSKNVVAKDTFWVTTGKWIKMANCPSGGRFSGTAFGIGNKGYIGLGTGEGGDNGSYLKDLWEFDPTLNQWTRKADFPAGTIRECTSFVIGNTAYVGLGTNTESFVSNQTLYAYNPVANVWTKKANYIGRETIDVVGLAATGKGYVTTGFFSTQFLNYDPLLNSWNKMNDFPGPERSAASGFVINDELYLGGGNSGQSLQYADLWKYSPSTNIWKQLTSAFSGGYPSISFSINGKGYRLLAGNSGGKGSKFYEYDPTTNQWSMKKAFPGISYGYQMCFVASNRVFVTCGLINNGYSAETWEFIP